QPHAGPDTAVNIPIPMRAPPAWESYIETTGYRREGLGGVFLLADHRVIGGARFTVFRPMRGAVMAVARGFGRRAAGRLRGAVHRFGHRVRGLLERPGGGLDLGDVLAFQRRA